MSSWILSVTGIIILSSIICIIMPDGRSSDIVKCILAVITLMTVIKPIFNYENLTFNDEPFQVKKIEYQKDYLQYVNDEKKEEYYDGCQKILQSFNINGAKVSIDYCVDNAYALKIKKVTVDLQNDVIISDDEHIDIIEEIKMIISSYCGIELKFIEVI